MRRFWTLAAVLATVNVLTALAITLWLPSTVVRGPSAPAVSLLPQSQPIVSIPRNRDRGQLESRIRSVVHAEFRNAGLPVPEQPPATQQVGLRDEARSGGGRAFRFRPSVEEPEVRAMLTPFGVYRSGPAGLLMVGVAFAAFAASGIGLLYIVPGRLSRVRDAMTVSAGRNLKLTVIGGLGYLLIALLLFVLVALVTGIFFAVLLAALLAGASFMGLVALALALGRGLRNRFAPGISSPPGELLLGILLIFPLGLIPWGGWGIALVLGALGFGALLVSRFGSEQGWSLEPLRSSRF